MVGPKYSHTEATLSLYQPYKVSYLKLLLSANSVCIEWTVLPTLPRNSENHVQLLSFQIINVINLKRNLQRKSNDSNDNDK